MDIQFTKRVASFFVKSIEDLKKESGGQRWNAICEDTALLFDSCCRKQQISQPYQQSEIWTLFFEPTKSYSEFEKLCQEKALHPILFTCLHALLDPPASWWQDQFK
jgi:hypothetical protein